MKFKYTLLQCCLLSGIFTVSAQPQSTLAGNNFVKVAPGVQLEVKDWGGTGRTVVLLAGLGGTLHTYDAFAPRLVSKFHVIGLTRRSYGASSQPEPVADHYDADRLGDDVLSALEQMHINSPILIGHSFGGEELSSVCSRHPQRVAGLVYLDAANRYAFSPTNRGDFRIDTLEMRRALSASLDAISPAEATAAIEKLQALLPQFAADLEQQKKQFASAPAMSSKEYADEVKDRSTSEGQIAKAALDGERRYTNLSCPMLAIFALPHDNGLPPGPKRDAADAWDVKIFGPLADDFEKAFPNARVVRIAHAKHAVYDSNPVEVVEQIENFARTLKAQP